MATKEYSGTITVGELLIILAVLAFCTVCGYLGGRGSGFENGVRAAAKGEYVVTQLPDGSSVVTKSKPTPGAPQ